MINREEEEERNKNKLSMGKNDKDLLTLQREEESSLKKKDLMDKFVKIVDFLWETKSISKELTPEGKLKEVRKALLNSTFQFSSMYRSWIPKPNKPGQLRPITQPDKADLIVMDALPQKENIVFEDLFLTQSHGFRKGRGPRRKDNSELQVASQCSMHRRGVRTIKQETSGYRVDILT